ncbi:MAG TPA: EF-hand domain-containing protein [Terriglobales bacterium]|nr:EF-hand domain-containing protein [Terriglobales bacterium]
MSSSVGNSSLLNLALLNQLLQKAGAETTDAGGASDSQATQDSSSGMSFSTQADALINALDTDGDGKLSKAELQTGFQKLSQDMRSFLIGQQNIGSDGGAESLADTTVSSLDTDGDGTLSQSELEAAFSSTGTTQGSDTTSVSNASSQGSTLGTAENWDAWMQQMQGSNTGDVANQSAMNSLQQSTKMDNTLTQLLQAVENYQASASGAV